MKVARKSKPVHAQRKTIKARAPAWAHQLMDRFRALDDMRDGLAVGQRKRPGPKALAAAAADVSMAILQFTIVMDRIERPHVAATMAPMDRELIRSHKSLKLFRK